MADRTGIQWTRGDDGTPGSTWNPIRGCSRVSPGCVHCYAETIAARFSGEGQPYHGLADWVTRPGGRREARWTGKLALVDHMLDQPIRWRRPRRIFVNSMSDLFHEDMPEEWIDRVFAVMARAPRHTFQVLTKRPERARVYLRALGECLSRADLDGEWFRRGFSVPLSGAPPWPFPNVWLGASVEDQTRADERIPILLDTPAAVRWISAEPLLGPVDLDCVPWPTDWARPTDDISDGIDPLRYHGAHLDWVVIGGESGPGARSMDLAWARSLVEQCRAAGTVAFVKQLGQLTIDGPVQHLWNHSKGGDPAEWPADLRVREYPR